MVQPARFIGALNFDGTAAEARAQRERYAKASDLISVSRRIRELMNTILANGAYSTKEEWAQLERLDEVRQMTVNKNNIEAQERFIREKDLLSRTWQMRRQLAEQAMKLLDEMLIAEGLPSEKRGDLDSQKEIQTVQASDRNQSRSNNI